MNMQREASPRRTTIAFVHGWAEGGRLSERLAHTMEQRGFVIVKDAATADILFAHSLGCYLLPRDAVAKLIILVGLPHKPTRNLPASLVRKLARELSYHHARGEVTWWCKKRYTAYGV